MELPNRPTKDPYQEIPIKDYSYVNDPSTPVNKGRAKWPYLVSGVFVLLIILGAGGYLLVHHTKPKPPPKHNSSTTSQTVKQSSNQSATNIPLTSYSSSNFNLTVGYPSGWTVSDKSTTSMTITSATGTITAASGQTVSGRTVVSVFNAGQLPTAFGTSSVAVLNSQLIHYTSPTSSQLASAYLSFVQYPATTTLGGLDAIYITGNDGYTKDQTIPSTDLTGINPLVIVSFVRCNDINCANPTPLTIASTDWTSTSFSAPLLAILKSFSFT